MTWTEETDQRTLAIPKSNWGPSRIMIDLDPVTHSSGAVIGFTAASEWRRRTKQPKTGKETGFHETQETHEQSKMNILGGEYAGIGR